MKKMIILLGFGLVAFAGKICAQTLPLTAITNVNVGTGLNLGNGDNAVLGFEKVNTNITILSNNVAVLAPAISNLGSFYPRFYATNHVAFFGAFPNGFVSSPVSVTNIYVSLPGGFTNIEGQAVMPAVGERIIINFAGNNGQFYQGIISNVYSATAVGLYTPVANALTNYTYAIICTTNSETGNTTAFQNWLNSASNTFDTDLILDPPIFYSAMLGMTNVGNCYMLTTNQSGWQRPNENNAMLIVPPLMGKNPQNLNRKATVEITGSYNMSWWATAGYAQMSFGPNESVIVVDAIGNDQTGTNFIGNSFLDARAFGVSEASGPNPISTYGIPDNDCIVKIKNISVVHSYDSHMAILNLAGCADGAEVDNCQIVGGDFGSGIDGTSYEWGLKHFESGTNSIGIIMPDAFEGNFGFLNYDAFGGDWAAIECGNVIGNYVTVANCYNVCDFGYSPSLTTIMDQLNLGGEIAVFHVRNGVQEPPARLYAKILTLGGNVMPYGTNIDLFNDEYWMADRTHDGFYETVGEIDVDTNINSVNFTQGWAPAVVWTNWNYNGNFTGYNGLGIRFNTFNGPLYVNGQLGVNYVQAAGNVTLGPGSQLIFNNQNGFQSLPAGSVSYWGFFGIGGNNLFTGCIDYRQDCGSGTTMQGVAAPYSWSIIRQPGNSFAPNMAVWTNGTVGAGSGFVIATNTAGWNLTFETNGMVDGSGKFAMSNSVPVFIICRGGVATVTLLGAVGGGVIP